MSEYQYYEFQALDGTLTPQEQRAVSHLSSRVDPHPRRAVFVYNYSDFPGEPLEILACYYDAMFYIASWGSVQLAFRLPAKLVNLDQLKRYEFSFEDEINCYASGEHVIINIERHDDSGIIDWVDGEDYLGSLLPLRDDLMQGDYRLLYLAWLEAISRSDMPDDTIEPPLPAGLNQLSRPLKTFTKRFGPDKQLLSIAAQSSSSPAKGSEPDYQQLVAGLPAAEQQAWLVRLAQNEPNLGIAFRRHLTTAVSAPLTQSGQRTIGQIKQQAQAGRTRVRQEARARAEARRLQELDELAVREESLWTEITALIEERKAKLYDEALNLLITLHNLALHRGTEQAYERRLKQLRLTVNR
jgi:hypothetical protein